MWMCSDATPLLRLCPHSTTYPAEDANLWEKATAQYSLLTSNTTTYKKNCNYQPSLTAAK